MSIETDRGSTPSPRWVPAARVLPVFDPPLRHQPDDPGAEPATAREPPLGFDEYLANLIALFLSAGVIAWGIVQSVGSR